MGHDVFVKCLKLVLMYRIFLGCCLDLCEFKSTNLKSLKVDLPLNYKKKIRTKILNTVFFFKNIFRRTHEPVFLIYQLFIIISTLTCPYLELIR